MQVLQKKKKKSSNVNEEIGYFALISTAIDMLARYVPLKRIGET